MRKDEPDRSLVGRRLITRRGFLSAGAGAAVGLLVVGGCGGSDAGGSPLSFPTWQAEEPGVGKWWEQVVAGFQKGNEGVSINKNQITYDQYVDTLTTRFSAIQPPDIVHLPSRNFAQFANQGWLAPLDDRLGETDIPETWTPLQKEMVWNGQTQGVLLLGYGYLMFYNERLLEEAGANVPSTPEELLEVAKAATRKDTFGFGGTTTEHPNVYEEASQFVVGEGASWVTDGGYDLTSPEVERAIDHYREALEYSPEGVSSEQKRTLFYDGKIAIMLDGPFVLPQREDAPESVKPYVKVARQPFPNVPGAVSNSLHVAASADSETQQQVWEFIELAASPEWQRKYAELYQVPPAREGAITQQALADTPELRLFDETTAQAVSVVPQANNIRANYERYSSIIRSGMLRLQTTDTPTATVLRDVQRELESEVKI